MYELLYIVPAIYAEDELKNVIAKIEALLKEEGAEVVKSEAAGKLKFAYPIKSHTVGYYILALFNAEGDSLKKINRALQLEKDVLRHMVTTASLSKAEVKIKEYAEVDPSERRFQQRPAPIARDKDRDRDKIKLEDIDKKLDVLLEKDIV
jgi:ribosomal protein S6